MLFTTGFGLAQAFRLGDKEIPIGQEMPLSLGGLSLLAVLSLTWRILRRDYNVTAVPLTPLGILGQNKIS